MKALNHTAGEWHATEWACHAPTTILTEVGGQTIVVAECCGHGRHSDESIDDARLIAAAKDLLAACTALLEHARWQTTMFEASTPEARMAIRDAEDAITKATGVAA